MPKPHRPRRQQGAFSPPQQPGPAAVGKPPFGAAEPAGDEHEGQRPALPHERDESVGDTASEPDAVIEQAKRDLDAGQVDTDLRATPGLDAERRKQHEPG